MGEYGRLAGVQVSSFFNATGTIVVGSTAQTTGILDIAAGSTLGTFGPNVQVATGGILNINGGITTGPLSLDVLTVSGTINFNGGSTLQVQQLSLTGGVIASTSTIQVVQQFLWDSGTLLGQGSLVSSTSMVMQGSGLKYLDARDVIVQNVGTWQGTSTLTLRNGANLEVAPSSNFTIESTGGFDTLSGGVPSQFRNRGLTMVRIMAAASPPNALCADPGEFPLPS